MILPRTAPRFELQKPWERCLRLNLLGSIPDNHAFALEELLNQQAQVISCKVYQRTGSLAITYTGNTETILAFILSTDISTVAKHLPPASAIILRPMSLWEGILREYLEDHTRDKSRHELIYSLLDMPSRAAN